MLLYKRYLLKRVAGYFLMISTILICLIWFTRAISFIGYITEKGIGIMSFLYLFVLILPWLALLIIPISLFIGVLVCYGRMNASNEITILKNSGLTKINIIKPAIIIASFLSLFCYVISLYLMPLANKNLRITRDNFRHNYSNIMISPGIFESLNNITIYVKDRDKSNKLTGVLLYDNYNKDSSITLSAKDGHLIQEDGSVLMRLKEGTLQKYNYEQKNSEILHFDEYVVNLSENKSNEYQHVWKASERYLHELLYADTTKILPKQIPRLRVEVHQRLTYPLFSIILALIACAYVLKGEFSRRGSSKNTILAVICACLFITITMFSYDLMEKSSKYTILLYSNIIFFILFPTFLLKNNFRTFK